jgi:tetratricopeptide (TPR) repeat protein
MRRRFLLLSIAGLLGSCAPTPDLANTAPHSNSPLYQAYLSHDERALASFWSTQGDDARALRYWSAEANPSLTLLRLKAQTYLDLGNWDGVTQTLQNLLEQAPDDSWANYQMALLLAATDRTQSRLYLRRSVQGDTSDPLISQLQTVLDDNPPDLAFQIGQVLAQAGEWRSAERAFLIAASLDNSTTAISFAYSALMRNLQNKSALILIQQALRLSPEDPTIQYINGIILRGEERYDESLNALQFAYALAPENAVFVAEIGMAYLMLNDHSTANAWLQHAFDLAQEQPDLQAALQRYAQNGNASILLPELPEP